MSPFLYSNIKFNILYNSMSSIQILNENFKKQIMKTHAVVSGALKGCILI